MTRQGLLSGSTRTKRYPGKSGRLRVVRRGPRRDVTSRCGMKVVNPWRSRFRTARSSPPGFNCARYHASRSDRPASSAILLCPESGGDDPEGLEQNVALEAHAAVLDVEVVPARLSLHRARGLGIARAHLGEPGDPRLHLVAQSVARDRVDVDPGVVV